MVGDAERDRSCGVCGGLRVLDSSITGRRGMSRWPACGAEILSPGAVSRILSHALRRGGRHFSQARRPAGALRVDLATAVARSDAIYPQLMGGPPSCLFYLAPEGVFRAAAVAGDAVGSCPTFSPLPDGCPSGGLFSVTLSVASGLTRRARAWREPRTASCPVVSGLSSPGCMCRRGITRALWIKEPRSDNLAPRLRTGMV